MENLKYLRKEAGLSQQQMADTLGISQQAYANYENNKREPDRQTIIKLANYFDVSTDFILDIVISEDEIMEKTTSNKQPLLGEKLKDLRTQKGLTQDAMAALLNIKRQTYSAYERGISFPDINALLSMANFFDVSVDFLLENKIATVGKQSLSEKQNKILELVEGLTDREREELIRYAEFLKQGRKED